MLCEFCDIVMLGVLAIYLTSPRDPKALIISSKDVVA